MNRDHWFQSFIQQRLINHGLQFSEGFHDGCFSCCNPLLFFKLLRESGRLGRVPVPSALWIRCDTLTQVKDGWCPVKLLHVCIIVSLRTHAVNALRLQRPGNALIGLHRHVGSRRRVDALPQEERYMLDERRRLKRD